MALLLAISTSIRAAEKPFTVVQILPGDKSAEVELEPLFQIHVSEKFDAKTLTPAAVQLSQRGGKPVEINISGDLGGVITLSVERPLKPGATYELKTTAALQSISGKPLRPMSIRFTTTANPATAPREDIAGFQFEKLRIDARDGVCGLALAPGNKLFACTWDGKLLRYDVGANPHRAKLVLERNRRFDAITVDPQSTPQRITLWLSHDSQQRLSLGPNDFSGVISRITIAGNDSKVHDVVTGLPTGDHPASGLIFGPDGRLYVSQGALTMLGHRDDMRETPLSAATLAIDIRAIKTRLDLAPDHDTATGPIEVFATGIREAFDLCWHSSGNLYAGVNMNDTNDKTPAHGDLPAVNVRPAEMMLRIVRGKYYGHPNPSRGQWVLLGGNPTAGADPWEVPQLPVGTMPDPNFDPGLLIRNLEKDNGPSADGVCEWRGEGPLARRLIFCFYTATRGLHTYKLSEDGAAVVDHQPLVDASNRILRFGAPLDVVYDPRGWLYVADFSAPERGDSGMRGGVWLARPL